MALNGNLDAFPLPEVLRLLARSQQTGVLAIMTNSGETRAYLEDGQLMFACDGDADTLRHGLVKTGLVPDDVWPEIMSGTLVAEDVVSPGTSAADLQAQVLSISVDAFVDALMSDNAAFEFEDGVTTAIQLSAAVNIDEVLVAAEERFNHWQVLLAGLPSKATKLKIVGELPDSSSEIILSAQEWMAIAAVSEHRTRASIAHHSGWSGYETAVAVTTLFELGLAEIVTTESGRPVEVFSEIAKVDKKSSLPTGLSAADAVMAGLVADENGLAKWGNELEAIAPSYELLGTSLAPLAASDRPAEFTSTDDFSFELQGLGERNPLERTRPIRDEDIAAAAANVELPLSALLAEHGLQDAPAPVRSYEPIAEITAEITAEAVAETVAEISAEMVAEPVAEISAEPTAEAATESEDGGGDAAQVFSSGEVEVGAESDNLTAEDQEGESTAGLTEDDSHDEPAAQELSEPQVGEVSADVEVEIDLEHGSIEDSFDGKSEIELPPTPEAEADVEAQQEPDVISGRGETLGAEVAGVVTSLDDQLTSVIGGMGDVGGELSLELVEADSELLDVAPDVTPSDLDLSVLVTDLEEVGQVGQDEIAQGDSSTDDNSDREETATDSEPTNGKKLRPARKRRSRGLLSRELSSLND